MNAGGWYPTRRLGLVILVTIFIGITLGPAGAHAEPAAAYQDRILENLPPDAPVAEQGMGRNLAGWPRLLRVESRWRKGSYVDPGRTQQTQYLYGLVETPNHGVLSIDGEIGPDRGLGSLTLRHSEMPLANGWWASHEAGLIYTPREGGGRIEGIVYLDANQNGKRDLGEAGAVGVQVALDNRYVVRTDAHGRYEFALVAAGTHTVTVRNESLPLPWSVVGDGQMRVEVGLRDNLSVDFPVHRTD